MWENQMAMQQTGQWTTCKSRTVGKYMKLFKWLKVHAYPYGDNIIMLSFQEGVDFTQ